MSLWDKFNTLVRATTNAPVEKLVEENSMKIFQQEIRDAERVVSGAKQQLATVMAQYKQLSAHNELLHQHILRREQQTLAAMEKGEQGLAEELAQLIADDEMVLKEQQQQQAYLLKQKNQLKGELRIAVRAIQNHQRQLDVARANQSAQHAIGGLRGHSAGLSVSLKELDSSLASIQQQNRRRWDCQQALIEIDAELDGGDLDQRLINVGIKGTEHHGAAVLERLEKQRRGESS